MTDIVIIGEAWGQEEKRERKPFVGASGRLLKALLHQSGIDWKQCFLTNVFNFQPSRNDIKTLCGPKAESIPNMPPLGGKYVQFQYAPELARLYKEIENERPNIIIALGASAAWATMESSGIRKVRGAIYDSPRGKVLPTYHPSAVLRDWSLRPIVLADLAKAKRESLTREYNRPEREIWLDPTIEDLGLFQREHIEPNPFLSVDIETVGDQITCVGFAPTKSVALVVPLVDYRKTNNSYWAFEEERVVWSFIRRWCSMGKRLVFQNGMYDIKFLWKYGVPVPDAAEDTMLLHHALQPEMEKGLGFLGSVYTDEASWKFMRPKNETVKREE